MRVRDLTLPKTDYKGRLTDAADDLCPCRPCWHPHDCGHGGVEYLPGGRQRGKWVTRMECATRWNGGCPQAQPPPVHVPPASKRAAQVCKRCGAVWLMRYQWDAGSGSDNEAWVHELGPLPEEAR